MGYVWLPFEATEGSREFVAGLGVSLALAGCFASWYRLNRALPLYLYTKPRIVNSLSRYAGHGRVNYTIPSLHALKQLKATDELCDKVFKARGGKLTGVEVSSEQVVDSVLKSKIPSLLPTLWQAPLIHLIYAGVGVEVNNASIVAAALQIPSTDRGTTEGSVKDQDKTSTSGWASEEGMSIVAATIECISRSNDNKEQEMKDVLNGILPLKLPALGQSLNAPIHTLMSFAALLVRESENADVADFIPALHATITIIPSLPESQQRDALVAWWKGAMIMLRTSPGSVAGVIRGLVRWTEAQEEYLANCEDLMTREERRVVFKVEWDELTNEIISKLTGEGDDSAGDDSARKLVAVHTLERWSFFEGIGPHSKSLFFQLRTSDRSSLA